MIREYWKNPAGFMVYMSNDEENAVFIKQLWSQHFMTYFKENKDVGYHFKLNENQIKKLPLKLFTRIS